MKNTVTLTCTDFVCECLDSIDDGTNRIFIAITVGNKTNPKLNIYRNGSMATTINLVANSENNVLIPVDYYVENASIEAQFTSLESESETISFVFPSKITGNMTLQQRSRLIYYANYPEVLEDILLRVYPVGSIYMSINNIDPSTLFGGTWETWGTGQVPVGVDTSQTEFNAVEKTGGETTHTLTQNQVPSHNHIFTPSGTIGSASVEVKGVVKTAIITPSGTIESTSITPSGTIESTSITPSGTIASAGAHTHTVSGTAASAGAHTHRYGYRKLRCAAGDARNVTAGLNTANDYGSHTSSSAGAHTHTVSGTAASAGAHTHTFTGTAASHKHTFTGASASHKHTFKGETNYHDHTFKGETTSHEHTFTGAQGATNSVGGGDAHNNLQPYITCYMWKRTA